MSSLKTKLDFQTWLYIECYVPFLIVLMIIPGSAMFHRPEMAKSIHLVVEVFTGGELPAVAFCMLLPTLVLGIQHEAPAGVLIAVLVGAIFAFLAYCACKVEPLEASTDPFEELVLIRSIISALLMLSTTYLSISVRQVALAEVLKGSRS